MDLTLNRLEPDLWIARVKAVSADLVDALSQVPANELWSLTQTGDEVSVVSTLTNPPGTTIVVGPWTAYRVAGTLDFALVGILHSLTGPLAAREVSVFALSTYDTDYLLVRGESASDAEAAWAEAGIVFA